MKKNPIVDGLASLQEHAFQRERHHWWRANGETTFVVDLQKSRWDNSYYINIGVWINALGELHERKHELCHIVDRLEGPHDLKLALYLDAPVEDVDDACAWRRAVVRTFVEQDVLPLAERCKTLDGLRAEVRHGILRRAGIAKDAQDLGVTRDKP